MSAYMCTQETIALVAAYVADTAYNPKTCTSMTGDEVAATLWAQNARSVEARYPCDDGDAGPAPTVGKKAQSAARVVQPVAVLKMCGCIEYQSCETGDWPDTLACTLLEAARAKAIRRLPGYEDAPRDLRNWSQINPEAAVSLSAMI